jgi:hypothetical protein
MKFTHVLPLFGAFFATSLVSHSATVVIGPATVEGSSEIGEPVNGYGSFSGNTVQFVLPNSILGSLQGSNITGLAFRLDNSYAPSLPSFGYDQMTIQIGYTSASDLSGLTDINANIAAATGSVTAYNQSFFYGPNAFPNGATPGSTTPNNFGPFINFTNSFAYTTGNLLVTIRHNVPITPEGDPFFVAGYYSSDAEDLGTQVVIGEGVDATSGFNYSYTPVIAFTNDVLAANYAIPEPTSALLGALGLSGSVLLRRRKA